MSSTRRRSARSRLDMLTSPSVRPHLAPLAFLCVASLAAASGGLGPAGVCADGCDDADCGTEAMPDDCADHGGESPDDCAPGCTDCGCCARVSGLPVTFVVPLLAFQARGVDYDLDLHRAPTAPESSDRDAVPRAATACA